MNRNEKKMAKIAKKNVQKKATKKQSSLGSKKEKKDFKIKDFVVNLIRLSKKDIENMVSKHQKSPEVITHKIQIKMKSEEGLNVNGVGIESNGTVEPSFDIALKIKFDKIIVESCQNIANIQEPKSESKLTVKTLTQLINEEWRRNKRTFKESKQILNNDAIVMAKMKGYSP